MRIFFLSLMIMMVSVVGCKKKGSGKYKYNDPSDPIGWEAANCLNDDDSATLSKLLKKGVNPNIRDGGNHPLLHTASVLGAKECVKVLLENGADVNIKNHEGTALGSLTMFTSVQHHTEIAKLLIDAGIDISIKDKKGFTAFDNARANNLKELTAILEGKMKALGIKIEEPFVEISTVPEISIKKIRGIRNSSGFFPNRNDTWLAENKSILEIINYSQPPSRRVFKTENLPQGTYTVELKKSLKAGEMWPKVKEAFEKTFSVKFLLENRTVDIYALKMHPKNKLTLEKSSGEGGFERDYTGKGYHLKNCKMRDLCELLAKELKNDVVDKTALEGEFDLLVKYFEFRESLSKLGLLLAEEKVEKQVIVVEKVKR